MRRSLALLLLIGLLAAILWWLASGSKADPDHPLEPANSSQAPAPGAPLAGGGLDANPDAGSALQRDAAELAAPAAPPAAATDPAETFRVRVVRAEDGAPVPGAEVLFLDGERVDQTRRREVMERHHDQERVFDELGVVFKAGDDGVAVLPKPVSLMWIAARHENRYGTEWGADRSTLREELVLRIVPVIHVKVHVEDEIGIPLAGVTVGYLVGSGGQFSLNGGLPTDGRGDAELRHLETMISDYERGQRHRIVAMLPGPEPPGVEFALDHPPTEPVRIVVPRCGSVLVEVLDLAGAPVGDGVPIRLQGALSAAERAAWKERIGSDPEIGIREGLGSQKAVTAGGVARFPHVPVGIRLECFGSPDRSGAQVAVEADGPQRPGEEVRIRLQQDSAHPRLTGRLVDAAGIPLGATQLRTTYWRGWPYHPGSREEGGLINVDAEGRFEQILSELEVPPGVARILTLRRLQDESSRLQSAWIFVPERVLESGYDAGDVRLGGPVVVSGTVVRGDGSPVPGALITARARIAPPDAENDGSNYEVTGWGWKSGADGQFSLDGEVPGVNHHLEVQPPGGGKAVYLPFTPGATGLRIVLEETGEIRGRILLDPGIPGDLIGVDLHRTAPRSPDGYSGVALRVDRISGEFASGPIPAGTWTAQLTLHWIESLAMIPDIAVPAAGATADPRLQIDLRGKLFLHHLVVEDADGGQPERLYLSLENGKRWTFWEDLNPHDFLTTTPVTRGVVGAQGWGRTEVRFTGGELRVRVGRGIPVRLEFFGSGLPSEEDGLDCHLQAPAGQALSGTPYFFAELIRTGWTFSTVVPAPGAYRVRVEIRAPDPADKLSLRSAQIGFGGREDYEVQVAAGQDEQVFRIEITAEMVAAALAAPR